MRLSEAGETITNSKLWDRFSGQKSFQAAMRFLELITRLRNYNDLRKVQSGQRMGSGHSAMDEKKIN